MLQQLRLTNFKQHRALTVNFDKGVNAILGENAHGKTTILKSILFALQGATGAGNKDHLTTRGETGMKVELDWDLGQAGKVTIIRTLSSAKVLQDGKPIASGQVAVTRWVEDQLGMASKMFKSLLYAEQGKTQKLLDDGPTDLQKQLEVVAQSQIIDIVLTMIKSDNEKAEGELTGIGQVPDMNGLRDLLEAAQNEFQVASETLTRTSVYADKVEASLKSAQTEYDQNLQISLSANQLRIEKGRLEGERDILVAQKAKLEAAEVDPVDRDAIDALDAEITSDLANANARQRKLDKLISDHAAYQDLVNQYNKLLPMEEIIDECDALQSKVAVAADAATLARSELMAREGDAKKAVCSTCSRPFDDTHLEVAIAAVNDARQRFEAANDALTKVNQELTDFLAQHSTDLKRLAVTKNTLNSLRLQMDTHPILETINPNEQPDIDKLCEVVKAKKDRLEELRDRARAYNTWVNQYESAKSAFEDVERRLGEATDKLGSLAIPSDDLLRSLKDEVNRWSTELLLAKDHKLLAAQTYTGIENRIADLTKQIESGEAKADRVARIKHETADRVELQKYLRNNRSRLMDEAWTALTVYTSHLVSSVTDGAITNLTRDDSGEFFAIENGHPTPVEELSGAQKSIIGLCLRLSLSHLFYGDNGFVLLDEVTADCSEANSAKVAGMLRGLNSQVVMVTHRQGDAVNANNAILLS
jgi:DNA repair exonuclease SbcCD ATPase subunit